ncbi:MAG TPA: chemotaxis protein CheW [Vicinamibacterales bacterium]|nr:chemotaxis protein CheW [Vicinamibacterales bacterium]
MIFLLFQLDESRFALDARQVVEVLPLVDIRRIPQAPDGVAGIIDFRGTPVPVVDLSLIILGRPAHRLLSTRLVVVRSADHSGHTRFLGLIAERATGTLRREPADFIDSGVTTDGALYLGPVAADERGFVQWVDASQILPPLVRDALSMSPAVPE